MPIYEFYCVDCHTLFSFFSQRVDTEAHPSCPACDRPRLERRPSRFATLSHQTDDEADPLESLDEDRLAGAMDSMLDEIDQTADGDQDPRQLARLLRRMGEASGLEPGPRMEELMGRLEAGEDPDLLEEEVAGDLDDDGSLEEFFRLKKRGWRSASRPRVDDRLYFL